MTIVVLGWGSLIWNPGELPLTSRWHNSGPELPVEFARQSNDGRLTLVIHGDHFTQCLWATLSCSTLDEARQELGWREGCVNRNNTSLLSRHIGWWNPGGQSTDEKYPFGHNIEIEDWARRKGVAGVVWTALPTRKGVDKNKNGRFRSVDESIAYLRGLTGGAREKAFEYIKKTPTQIRTPYRKAFETAFPELG